MPMSKQLLVVLIAALAAVPLSYGQLTGITANCKTYENTVKFTSQASARFVQGCMQVDAPCNKNCSDTLKYMNKTASDGNCSASLYKSIPVFEVYLKKAEKCGASGAVVEHGCLGNTTHATAELIKLNTSCKVGQAVDVVNRTIKSSRRLQTIALTAEGNKYLPCTSGKMSTTCKSALDKLITRCNKAVTSLIVKAENQVWNASLYSFKDSLEALCTKAKAELPKAELALTKTEKEVKTMTDAEKNDLSKQGQTKFEKLQTAGNKSFQDLNASYALVFSKRVETSLKDNLKSIDNNKTMSTAITKSAVFGKSAVTSFQGFLGKVYTAGKSMNPSVNGMSTWVQGAVTKHANSAKPYADPALNLASAIKDSALGSKYDTDSAVKDVKSQITSAETGGGAKAVISLANTDVAGMTLETLSKHLVTYYEKAATSTNSTSSMVLKPSAGQITYMKDNPKFGAFMSSAAYEEAGDNQTKKKEFFISYAKVNSSLTNTTPPKRFAAVQEHAVTSVNKTVYADPVMKAQVESAEKNAKIANDCAEVNANSDNTTWKGLPANKAKIDACDEAGEAVAKSAKSATASVSKSVASTTEWADKKSAPTKAPTVAPATSKDGGFKWFSGTMIVVYIVVLIVLIVVVVMCTKKKEKVDG